MDATITATLPPAVARLYALICELAAGVGAYAASNRELAYLLNYKSASRMPQLLRRLESAGLIARTIDGRRQILTVIDHRDRSPRAAIDHPRKTVIDHPAAAPITVIERAQPIGAERSTTPQTSDRAGACMVDHDLVAASSFARDLAAEGVAASLARKIAAAARGKTIREFRDQVALARRLGKRSPLGLVASLWAAGQELADPAPARPPLPTLAETLAQAPPKPHLTGAEIAERVRALRGGQAGGYWRADYAAS